MVTASGNCPLVNAFDKHIKSGDTFAKLDAKSEPVRPKPVATSSEIRCTPWCLASCSILFVKC